MIEQLGLSDWANGVGFWVPTVYMVVMIDGIYVDGKGKKAFKTVKEIEQF